ncbi:olfactory receptor 6B1-like [Mantella aurantiaca]
MTNKSRIVEVILVGFPGLSPTFFPLVSSVLFLIYIMSLFANGTVISLIILKAQLQKPMYVVIANLAASDLLFDTITLPKIVARYWFGAESMSFFECLFQVFWVHMLGTMDAFILLLMSIDRYVAICRPLRYSSMISNHRLGYACTLFGFLTSLTPLYAALSNSTISYCGRFRINSCFCNNIIVHALACEDISFQRYLSFALALFVLLTPLAFIIFSYVIILAMVHSSRNGQKAFYTCTTHLFVIALYYIPRLFVYTADLMPVKPSADINVLLLCLYTFTPHVANPIIYCLRTEEIKQTLRSVLEKHLNSRIHQNVSIFSIRDLQATHSLS